jgi:hypothetical protein
MAAVLTLAMPLTVGAQTERVTINTAPRPDQTIHIRIVQDMDFEATTPSAALPPSAIKATSVMAMTETVGHPDDRGKLEAQIRYDEISEAMSVNGIALPVPQPLQSLAGQTITAAFDDQGHLQDLVLPPGLEPLAATLRPMISSMAASLPAGVTLGVGESAAVPFTFPLPLPTGNAVGQEITGGTTFKLVAIELDGADRTARLEEIVESAVSVSLGGASSQTLKVSGTGTLEWDIDRAFVKSNEMEMTVDGGVAGLTMHGTIHTRTTGN